MQKGFEKQILAKAAEAATTVVRSPQFMDGLVKKLLQNVAHNPGAFNALEVQQLNDAVYLVPPQLLSDHSIMVMTTRQIAVPTCYVAMVTRKEEEPEAQPAPEQPAIAGPTPEEEAGPTPADEEKPTQDGSDVGFDCFNVILWRDNAGDVTRNQLVLATDEEYIELQRQLGVWNPKGTAFVYVTKLKVAESDHDHDHSHGHS